MKRSPKKPSPYQKFAALSAEGKEAFYRECDDPEVALRAKQTSARMKKLWEKAKRS